MNSGRKTEICLLIGVLLSTASHAATSDTTAPAASGAPYDAIVERNVFNLHAPPPPLNPADLIKKTPPPKITLTGITTISGKKMTFLTMPATKPGAPPDSVALAEGQAQDDIEVKNIDEKAGIVQVVNHGEPQTLDFEHDGAKPTGGLGGAPAATMFPPPTAPPPNGFPLPQPGNVVRPLRGLPGRGTPFSGNNMNGGYGGGVNGGAINAMNGQNSQPLSQEEQAAVIELQRAKYQNENNPVHQIFPPTGVSLNPNAPPPAVQ